MSGLILKTISDTVIRVRCDTACTFMKHQQLIHHLHIRPVSFTKLLWNKIGYSIGYFKAFPYGCSHQNRGALVSSSSGAASSRVNCDSNYQVLKTRRLTLKAFYVRVPRYEKTLTDNSLGATCLHCHTHILALSMVAQNPTGYIEDPYWRGSTLGSTSASFNGPRPTWNKIIHIPRWKKSWWSALQLALSSVVPSVLSMSLGKEDVTSL